MSESEANDDGLSSANAGDSNAILLPQKEKKSKGKGKKDGKKKVVEPCMSKSKQRKLKQIQLEKERKAMLAKSMTILEKYKIRDEELALLHSSGTIGKVQTMREKRLRAAQFSKVGLELPEDDQPRKKKKGPHPTLDDNEDQMELYADDEPSVDESSDNNCSKQVELESTDCHQSPMRECNSNGFSGRSISETIPPKPATEEKVGSLKCNQNKVPLVPCSSNKLEGTTSQNKENDGKKFDCDGAVNNLNVTSKESKRRPTVLHVSRPQEVEENRTSLPIVMMEQEIMELINENLAVIICGETGCGKTTQVPQFLYEAGYGTESFGAKKGVIGITQPRRVAVLATAKRVTFELGLRLGKEVGFQVRHDKMLGDKCAIKFMTDGILLRELQSDFLLKKYSVLILDEAHERSLNTDILIGMLSRIIRERHKIYLQQQDQIRAGTKIKPEDFIYPLKVVLMSATLRVDDFISDRRIFIEAPPVIEVPSRQYTVTTHFSKKTDVVDYVGQAYKKAMQIHKKLPPGGILVFVTGQREVEYLCKKLRQASRQLVQSNFMKQTIKKDNPEAPASSETDNKDRSEEMEVNSLFDHEDNLFSTYEQDHEDVVQDSSESDTEDELEVDSDDEDLIGSANLDKTDLMLDFLKEPDSLASLKASFDALLGNESAQNGKEKSNDSIDQTAKECQEKSSVSPGALHVLPLYARLPASEQLRVFGNIREGERLVVVATNVAETSLTIPGIKYVVDTGREKVRDYNHANGMETYEVQWISKASAAQRTGRAGRVGPGHCYRLYSAAAFSNIFPEFSCPQITKIPVDGVLLLMKFMGINKVENFPFPTPPESSALAKAEQCLKTLEALDSEGKLTPIGKAMARYPMSPRHSRMLLTVVQFLGSRQVSDRANLVLGFAVAAAAALSFPNPFNIDLEKNNGAADDGDQNALHDFQRPEKLSLKKQKAIAKEALAKFRNPTSDALTIAYALQLFELAENPMDFCKTYTLHHKTMDEMSKLRKQLLQLIFVKSASNDEFTWNHGTHGDVERAWKISSNNHPLLMNEEEILGQAICAGWADRVSKRIRKVADLSEADRKARAIQYQSCALNETVFLHRRSSVSRIAPEFVVYSELICSKRPYMHGVTSVKADWLVKYARSLCNLSAPLMDPKPYYEPLSDKLLCWVSPTFGPHLWQLPLHSLAIKNDQLRVSVFACALLEGSILPCFKSVQTFLAAPPSSILRPEAAGHKRVADLVTRLMSGHRTIDGRSRLQEAWEENPKFLYPEILSWFQKKFHSVFEELWVEMHLEVMLDPQELYSKKVKKAKKFKHLRK